MSQNLSRQLRYMKEPVRSRGGAVAAQNQKAADVGASILAAGGNAVDAAIATAFALAPLEPWMSGLGGIGFMMVWDAKKRRAHTVDFGAISAASLDPADYPLLISPKPELLSNSTVEAADVFHILKRHVLA